MGLPAIAAMAAMTVLPAVLGGKPEVPSKDMPADIAGALRRSQDGGPQPLDGQGAAFGGDPQQSQWLTGADAQRRADRGQSPYLASVLRGEGTKSIDAWRGG
jgi:hypothetical protein